MRGTGWSRCRRAGREARHSDCRAEVPNTHLAFTVHGCELLMLAAWWYQGREKNLGGKEASVKHSRVEEVGLMRLSVCVYLRPFLVIQLLKM